MTAIDRLRAVVHDNPGDWQARLILADALEDSGDCIGANGQRWQAENKKYPTRYRGDPTYDWWTKEIGDLKSVDCLPEEIFDCLQGHRRGLTSTSYKNYRTIGDAESALAHALHEFGITAGVLAP